jgi:anti-sigma B factor antagonist
MADMATVIVERDGELQVVRIAGEVDISNAVSLADDISGAVPNDAAGLVLDLSETAYLDSAGIRMMFELKQRLEGRRQALAVVVPEESLIRHALVITEMEQAIPLYGTLTAALSALRGNG